MPGAMLNVPILKQSEAKASELLKLKKYMSAGAGVTKRLL
jgi:hypothetical protein